MGFAKKAAASSAASEAQADSSAARGRVRQKRPPASLAECAPADEKDAAAATKKHKSLPEGVLRCIRCQETSKAIQGPPKGMSCFFGGYGGRPGFAKLPCRITCAAKAADLFA